ncbi:GDP-mannose transporter GONST1-like isoform X1 [Canna indica]|uniref:GDP-mannose transporter GONST1-like isoform X1 n=1 Tax=Canna indica TaxID=4628 RepID=A0AAQ3KPI2_9LILI|nr:GDP-mannose transporter GONST1-like isoform X1 [Canna indica]
MGSNVLPLGAPLNSSDELLKRHNSESTSSPLLNGKRSGLKSHEQNEVPVPIPIANPVGSARRYMANRSGAKYNIDLEDGRAEKDGDKIQHDQRPVRIQNQALLSGLAYCISSCSMIMVNKFVLSGYDFSAAIALMLYQNLVSVTVISTLSLFGVISTEPLTWKLVKVWLPVNVIFVGMLITSMFSLKYINVAMVTILKNITNVITALGETYFFMKHHDNRVWTALFLMIISAISGGMTDLSFHVVGYAWQVVNCFLSASYSLTLRRVMDTAKQVTKSGNLNEFSMVLLNNTLSVPLGLLLIIAFDEVEYLTKTDNWQWSSGSGNQLHFVVVSSPNKCNYVQPCRIIE